jgi:hypothetical protein
MKNYAEVSEASAVGRKRNAVRQNTKGVIGAMLVLLQRKFCWMEKRNGKDSNGRRRTSKRAIN